MSASSDAIVFVIRPEDEAYTRGWESATRKISSKSARRFEGQSLWRPKVREPEPKVRGPEPLKTKKIKNKKNKKI